MDFLSCFLHELKQKANSSFGLNLHITIITNLKGFQLIGQCKKLSSKHYLIRLHAKLLNEFKAVYIKDVLTHEFAHAVQMELSPKSKPHSKEWKKILEVLSGIGYKDQKKIDYHLKNTKKTKTYLYKCACAEHLLSTIRHNRILKRTMIYRCKKCDGVLKFVG